MELTELTDKAGSLGVVGVFIILLIREILSWVERRESKENNSDFFCKHPGPQAYEATVEQVSDLWKEAVKSSVSNSTALKLLEELGRNMERQTLVLSNLTETSSRTLEAIRQISYENGQRFPVRQNR